MTLKTSPDSSRVATTSLRRTLSLPLLIFMGLGVTIGAGIFALVGEVLGLAGDHAPLAFLTAGVIASFTGISYMALVAEYPRAGGEAVYVTRGIGQVAGRFAGLGVVATGIVSSAVVSLAFGGYLASLVDVPERGGAVALVIALCFVAWSGVRQSVVFATVVTVVELGTLLVVTVFGFPDIAIADVSRAFDLGVDGTTGAVLAGAFVAFFAFIGFEDIANLAEETIDPRRTAPRAIAWTLGVTLIAYILLALVAVSLPNQTEIAESSAPMGTIFEAVSGFDPAPVATVASIAMVNGVLMQIVMASRVLYGMASEGQLPATLESVSRTHQTPTRATILVGAAILLLVTLFPLVQLARATSLITLTVFTLVNLSLVRLGLARPTSPLRRWLPNAVLGAATSAGLCVWQVVDLL